MRSSFALTCRLHCRRSRRDADGIDRERVDEATEDRDRPKDDVVRSKQYHIVDSENEKKLEEIIADAFLNLMDA